MKVSSAIAYALSTMIYKERLSKAQRMVKSASSEEVQMNEMQSSGPMHSPVKAAAATATAAYGTATECEYNENSGKKFHNEENAEVEHAKRSQYTIDDFEARTLLLSQKVSLPKAKVV